MVNMVCRICGETHNHFAKGLCYKCYQKEWRKDHPREYKKRSKSGKLVA